MSAAGMADHAAQVIVGRVAEVRSYWADNPRRIESEVTLEDVEYLKGRLAESESRFTLIVPGGQVGEMRMSICCAPELRVGEKWMLFLLPEYRTYPVVGLSQGAFLIKADADGVERVVSRTHGVETAVTGIGADGFIQHVAPEAADAHAHLVSAEKMRLVQSAPADAKAITYQDFVAELAPVLAASRRHVLDQPAGQRVAVTYKAVPLGMSEFERQRRTARQAEEPAPPLRGAGAAQRIVPRPRPRPESR
jgi:hypothetical protein